MEKKVTSKLPETYRHEVVNTLIGLSDQYDEKHRAEFYRMYEIDASRYSRIAKGEIDQVLSDKAFLRIGMKLGVSVRNRKWKTARTEVFTKIEEDVLFCKRYSKGKIFVDKCGIGKTYTGKYLSRTLKNCFYIDASQVKSVAEFHRMFARVIGADDRGWSETLRNRVKYMLGVLEEPVVIIDEVGDIDKNVIMAIKEYYNALDGVCGWYLMGANGMRTNMASGMRNGVSGYEELFDRMNAEFSYVTPETKDERDSFYRELCRVVIEANATGDVNVNALIAESMNRKDDRELSGLRRIENLMIEKGYIS